MQIAVYPGSFDPVTNGHLDIIYRASNICDKLIVAVLNNINKVPSFTVDERVSMLKHVLTDMPNVEISNFSGLLVDFMNKKSASIIIKGLRAVSDFEYELQMALLNKNINPHIETLFMMTSINYSFLSSRSVKELAMNGGKIDGLVPASIKYDILSKFGGV